MLTNIKAKFLSELAKQGQLPEGVEAEEPLTPKKQIQEEFNRSYVDARAIRGQAALNYIMYFTNFTINFRSNFFTS